MPTLPNMSLITPTLGGDSGTWDDKINACLALIDAHDHTSGKGVLVPVAGLDIDDDLAMGGNAVTGLEKLGFNAITALASGTKNLFVSSSDNELYWRSNAGANVKLTDGASLNITLVGGIVGDYSSVGAEVAYSDADDVYTFKQPTTWARLACGAVRIYETGTSESVYVEHAVATGLASSYTVTWPTALPPTYDSEVRVGTGGAISYQTLLKTAMISAHKFDQTSGTAHTLSTNASQWSFGSSLTNIMAPFEVAAGDVIKSVTFYVDKASDATNTLTVYLHTYLASTGVKTDSQSATLSTNAPGASTISIAGLALTTDTTHTYALEIVQSDSTPSAVDKMFGAAVEYLRVG
jgi:hypothetical protein